jgi:hypothetical protein
MKSTLATAALLAAFSFALAEDRIVQQEDRDADGDGTAEAHAESETEAKAGDDGNALHPDADADARIAECKAKLKEAMKGMKGAVSEECQKLVDDAMAEAEKDGHAVREVKEPGKTIKVEVKISRSGSSTGQQLSPQPEPKEKN